MERLADAAHSNTDAIRGAQDEIAEYRRQLQSRTIELETLRGTKDSLERQCMETEDRHHGDIHSLQVHSSASLAVCLALLFPCTLTRISHQNLCVCRRLFISWTVN